MDVFVVKAVHAGGRRPAVVQVMMLAATQTMTAARILRLAKVNEHHSERVVTPLQYPIIL